MGEFHKLRLIQGGLSPVELTNHPCGSLPEQSEISAEKLEDDIIQNLGSMAEFSQASKRLKGRDHAGALIQASKYSQEAISLILYAEEKGYSFCISPGEARVSTQSRPGEPLEASIINEVTSRRLSINPDLRGIVCHNDDGMHYIDTAPSTGFTIELLEPDN